MRWAWAGLLLVCAVNRASAEGILWSALDRPDRPDPVYISAGATLGGSPDWDAGTVGFNASILFRPSRAADFITALYHWNTGLVIDGEWRRLAERRDALTADLIFRKYLSDVSVGGGAALFAGFGGGLALVSFPVVVSSSTTAAEDGGDPAAPVETKYSRGEQRWWSTVVELGYESRPSESVVVTVKARWRSYVKRPYDYSSWTVHALVGIPIPW
jgi:hypothetical protein